MGPSMKQENREAILARIAVDLGRMYHLDDDPPKRSHRRVVVTEAESRNVRPFGMLGPEPGDSRRPSGVILASRSTGFRASQEEPEAPFFMRSLQGSTSPMMRRRSEIRPNCGDDSEHWGSFESNTRTAPKPTTLRMVGTNCRTSRPRKILGIRLA